MQGQQSLIGINNSHSSLKTAIFSMMNSQNKFTNIVQGFARLELVGQ
jgi:hypothetical protein